MHPEATPVATTEETISPAILNRRICDFDLRIEGRPLGHIVARLLQELESRGITRLRPSFYLSNEWGVNEGTIAIAIPFYLADDDLRRVQAIRGGVVEGTTEEEILRYLRHEVGHVVNYAYRLYETHDWTRVFGSMALPYPEIYQPQPFSPDYVRYLPGGYAQRHPDEDWAETFAVWMDRALDWREIYGDSPAALRKLEYCAVTMSAIKDRDPEVTEVGLLEDTRGLRQTVQEYYDEAEVEARTIPRSVDGDLRALFAARSPERGDETPPLGSASDLLRRNRNRLANAVWNWTGVDSSVMHPVVNHLIRRSAALELTYRASDQDAIMLEVTAYVTTLAMNHLYKGAFTGK